MNTMIGWKVIVIDSSSRIRIIMIVIVDIRRRKMIFCRSLSLKREGRRLKSLCFVRKAVVIISISIAVVVIIIIISIAVVGSITAL